MLITGLSQEKGQFLIKLQKPADQVDDNGQQKAQQDHRGEGKIKAEVVALDPDIAGQAAEPGKFIAQEENNKPRHKQDQPAHYQQFAQRGVEVHDLFFFWNSLRPGMVYELAVEKSALGVQKNDVFLIFALACKRAGGFPLWQAGFRAHV